jgi:hypothetical protein
VFTTQFQAHSVYQTPLPPLLPRNRIPRPHRRRQRRHLRERLVGENNVLLDGDGVLDLHPDDGRGDDQAGGEKTPSGAKLLGVGVAGWMGGAEGVDAAGDGGAGGLDPLVEAGEVGEFAGVIGEGAHEPWGELLVRGKGV